MTDAELIAKLKSLYLIGDEPGHRGGDGRDQFWDLVSQNTWRLLLMAGEWADVCKIAGDNRVSHEAIGIRVRNTIAQSALPKL